MRWVRCAVAGAAGVALVLAGSACTAGGPTSTDTQRYQINDQVQRLEVTDAVGRVEVTAGDGPAEVTETLRYSDGKPRTSHNLSGGTLKLANKGCPGHSFRRCEVDYEIRVPAATAVTVDATTAEVRLTGLAGDITASTTTGQIVARTMTSSKVTVNSTTGHVDLRFTAAPASTNVETTTGSIEIQVPGDQRYRLDVSTTTGSTTVRVPSDDSAGRSIRARATTGSVEVTPV